MADIVTPGAAIEGQKLEGSSREELKARGLVIHNQVKCHRFMATRDAKAQVREEIASGEVPVLEPGAITTSAAELICDKVLIHSLDKAPSRWVTARTATHQANFWDFKKRTAAKIDLAHQELLNALAKKLPPASG